MPSPSPVRTVLVPLIRRTVVRSRRSYGRQLWRVLHVGVEYREDEGSLRDCSFMPFQCNVIDSKCCHRVKSLPRKKVRACRDFHLTSSP